MTYLADLGVSEGRLPREFLMRDGRLVEIEEARGDVRASWFLVAVNGKYLNGDGWYGFVNPPVLGIDEDGKVVSDIVLAFRQMLAQALGGEY